MAKRRNISISELVSGLKPQDNLVASISVPAPDTENISGHEAYAQDKWHKLLTMLNTIKIDDQFYRSAPQAVVDLKRTVDECAKEDPYFVAQCIVYSRCVADGMRTVTQLASVFLSPHISGLDWSKRLYGLWNKKAKKGGMVYRPDDMVRIKEYFQAIHMNGEGKSLAIPNAMKKAFKNNLESLDSYSILKYKKGLIDIINLVHPKPNEKEARMVEVDGKSVEVLSAVIRGLKVSADTWEVAQSEAGQIVAQAVKEGKISEAEAENVLKEAKADNWKGLLTDKSLGILAALRNIRSILKTNADRDTLDMLEELLGDTNMILSGKIMPYQIDMAIEVINSEFNSQNSRSLVKTLSKSYEDSIPNLKEALKGRNLVMLDCSGSMSTRINDAKIRGKIYSSSCMDKAALIASTIAKATDADIIRFGSSAEYVSWNPNQDVFTMSKEIVRGMGGTNLSKAWQCASESGNSYDRVFILSDNECNVGSTYEMYRKFVENVSDPYVYSVDLCGYGTNPIAGPKVRYYYGYGFSMFEDISKCEFNPEFHIEKVKKVEI